MDWLINLGYLGLFIGTFISGTIIPMSSDLLLIGILFLDGNPWVCFVVATIGNWTGGMTSYLLGWHGNWKCLNRWFNVKKEKLEKQEERINRYGVWLILLSWIPFFGSLGVIALGYFRVKPQMSAVLLLTVCAVRFLAWTLLYIHFGETFTNWITK